MVETVECLIVSMPIKVFQL